VEMEVLHFLPPVLPGVHDQAPPLLELLAAREIRRDAHEPPREPLVDRLGEGPDMGFRHDEEMRRRLRADVADRDREVVLVERLRRDLAPDDLAEDALHGGASWRTTPRRAFQGEGA